MPSRSNPLEQHQSRAALKAGLLLLSVALNALEIFLPRIPLIPWLKPGLANIVTIAWVVQFGTVDALLFSLLRVWVVGFYFGFSILTLTLGLTGALAATIVMGTAWRVLGTRGWLGLAGLGVLGACAHNAGQLAAVYFLFARNRFVLYQIPFMAVASVIAGGVVGVLSGSLINLPLQQGMALPEQSPSHPNRHTVPQGLTCLSLLAWSVAVMFVDRVNLLTWLAIAATLLVQAFARGSLRAFFAPLRSFWLLLAMVAAVHLFFTYGQRIPGLPLVTYEGAQESARQLLRLWTWLQLSQILKWSGFGSWTMAALERLLPRRKETLTAGLLALEYFPETLSWARSAAIPALKRLFRTPRLAFSSLAVDLHRDLMKALQPAADIQP
jgi:heptaprenyl diphosphate synthase